MVDVLLASFLYIGLKSTQQVNVYTGADQGPGKALGYYVAIWPVSLLMACAEVYIVGAIVVSGGAAVLPLALGASLGCTCSMLIHWRVKQARMSREPNDVA